MSDAASGTRALRGRAAKMAPTTRAVDQKVQFNARGCPLSVLQLIGKASCDLKKKPAQPAGFFSEMSARLAGMQAYFAFISATVVSSMRFEKPHSLSYHDDTLTRRPDTLVSVESKFDEAGLWLKSIDTSGSVW
jgi:hypothetical protein